MATEFIQSRQNPRVQNLARLREHAHREAQQRFLVEGRRELERALARGVIEEIYFCEEHFRDDHSRDLVARAAKQGVETCQLAPLAYEKVSLREGPDGLLGVARAWKVTLEELQLSATPLLLIIERVEKPGNLGALLRSADAAGVDAVLVCDPVTDLFNPHVVRNSQGALFSVAVAACAPEEAQAFLQAKKITLIATTPAAKLDFWSVDLRGPVAMVVGGEKDGLTPFWLNAATTQVRIPMAGQADSLNVSAAATLALYEVVRQRRGSVGK
ncbi:MAG TPA: RNA methyltransferase [Opitutales bacterium]|nr:RNA methyltransferase [Opitutales bacterium]